MTPLTQITASAARPIPWHHLSWAVWRRHRTALMSALTALALVAIYLIAEGLQLRSEYDHYLDCSPAGTQNCQQLWDAFRRDHGESGLLGPALLFLPPFVGILTGASILGRELETGTFRYAWTQGIGRMRWAIAMLVSGALGVIIIMAVFGLLMLWHNQPLTDSGASSVLAPLVFPMTGLAPAGWALLCFALAALAGLVFARVVPAIVVSLAAWFGLAYLASNSLRPIYQQTATGNVDDLSQVGHLIDVTWLVDGVRASDAQVSTILQAIDAQIHQFGRGVDIARFLVEHGYEQVATYYPASQFWNMQLIETSWLTVAAFALLGATLWLVKRHPQ